MAFIGAAATIVAALIGLFVLLGGDSDAPDPGPSPSGSSPAPSAPSSDPTVVGLPEQFIGHWQGNAEELNIAQTDHYRVTLELNQGAKGEDVGRIHYEMGPSDCYGVVTLTTVDTSKQVTLGETIQSGNCVKNGRITLTLRPGNTLDFVYKATKHDGTEQSVDASLQKID
ncbi:hypothetical protein [Streptomyces sp. NPDC001530]|uniref:hypothetical protein n=1 Tax=Streptomyces sp. NPDC001530 TaxID=3364582 RepID=UPI0036BE08BC